MKLLLISHLILCFAYGSWWFRINREESVYRLVLTLTLPVVGFVALILLDLFAHKIFTFENIGAFGIEKHVKRISFVKLDVAKEVNLAPFEEVLLLNVNTLKRKFIIESLKKDIEYCIGFLTKALQDEDSETSHYAASVIMEIRRKLTVALHQYSVKYEHDKKNYPIAAGYAGVLKKFLESGLLDETSHAKYSNIYTEVLSGIIQLPDATAEHYTALANCYLDLKEYEQAAKVCDSFLRRFPESEGAYLIKLKLSFILRNKLDFDRTLAAFRRSDIRFSNDTLAMVRYWSGVTQ